MADLLANIPVFELAEQGLDKFDDSLLDRFDLSVANIKRANTTFTIKKAVREFEKHKPLSVHQINALFSLSVEDRHMTHVKNLPYPDDESTYDSLLSELHFSRSDVGTPIPKGNPIFPHGIHEYNIDMGTFTSIEMIAVKALEMASPDDKVEIYKHILDIYKITNGQAFEMIMPSLVERIEDSKAGKEIFRLFADEIWVNREKYTYQLSEKNWYMGVNKNFVNNLMLALKNNAKTTSAIEYLVEEHDNSETKKMLGMFVDSHGFPRIINAVRDYIAQTDDKRAVRIGRMLIGVDPDDDSKPFHIQLADVYRSVRFENYPPNLAMNEFELDLIDNLPASESEGITLDLACGTGRIANGIADRTPNVVGIDFSKVNLEKAEIENMGQKVIYKQADIANTGLKDESVKRTIFIGRSSTHAEKENTFDVNWLSEIDRITESGGDCLIDFPNPNVGEILEKRKVYIKMLQNLEIPITMEDGLKNFPYLVDSPDGTNMYNRWVPPIERVLQLFKNHGFEAGIYQRKPIETKNEDENIYIYAVKVK